MIQSNWRKQPKWCTHNYFKVTLFYFNSLALIKIDSLGKAAIKTAKWRLAVFTLGLLLTAKLAQQKNILRCPKDRTDYWLLPLYCEESYNLIQLQREKQKIDIITLVKWMSHVTQYISQIARKRKINQYFWTFITKSREEDEKDFVKI